MVDRNIAEIKAWLLSQEYIKLHPSIQEHELFSTTGNIGKSQWVFLRLSKTSRVRLTLSQNANLILAKKSHDYYIKDAITHETIFSHVMPERILVHAPYQLFFLVYKNCTNGCLFCPLTYKLNNLHYSWEDIRYRIAENMDHEIHSISFTTSCPPNKTQSELVDELIDITTKTRELMGREIPIGISLKTPSKENLLRLKDAGVTELRLNIEIYNTQIARELMPNKDLNKILSSIENAVNIFGREKVSSNMIVGLGESDHDILSGVSRLAEIGALSTLYPYDSIGIPNLDFKRPSAERIYKLALKHKEILQKYGLNPLGADTMCCSCAASHLYPGKDL